MRPIIWNLRWRHLLEKVCGAAASWDRPNHREEWPGIAAWSRLTVRAAGGRLLMYGLLAALALPGCHGKPEGDVKTVAKPPAVQIIKPPLKTIKRVVGQPSFIEAYERSSVYPKLTAYIDKWIVDIGDKVKRGDTLATLFVPELVEDFGTKKATVKLDEERISLAEKAVEVAAADVEAAKARLDEAKAILAKYQSEVDRWDTEVKRLDQQVKRGVVDPQILLESTNQFRSSTAARDAAKATIAKAEAEVLSRQAALAKASVDVRVARADLAVALSEAKRLEAWVGYLKLPAPFDGVVVERNANTFDFVLPGTGDPTANERSPHLSPSGQAAPIYVVDRTDIVRIFVDVPEQDANYVKVGTAAQVQARAFRDTWLSASVTRTSWALNMQSRTLRTEVDLPNPKSELLPGMYAYVKLLIERPKVRAVPVAALTYSGEKTYCFRHQDGRAVRAEVQTGVSDGEWIEVTNLQLPAAPDGTDPWAPVSGTEELIVGDLSILTDGSPVEVVPSAEATKVAEANPKTVAGNTVAPAPALTEVSSGTATAANRKVVVD
jgi:HlyD family secretion protein